jgi:nucleotide-binding universal stress UspA family protein
LGYHKSGKTYEEFAELMEHNARKDYSRFIKQFDMSGVAIDAVFELSDEPAKAVLEVARSESADLMVTGARGRSAAAAVLLGSITENLILTAQIPFLAVKKKGTGMGLLEALFSL